MKSLAASAPGVAAAFGPGDPPQAVDAHVPLCSLPHVLRSVPSEMRTGPYLRASRKITLPDVQGVRNKRVGLVCAVKFRLGYDFEQGHAGSLKPKAARFWRHLVQPSVGEGAI
jgi:hypothetical protein